MNLEHRVVVTSHRPWLRWGMIALITMLLLAAAWALYSYTRSTTVSDYEETRAERERLVEQRRQLIRELKDAKDELLELKEQIVYMERSQDIDRTAFQEVRNSLGSLQAELSESQEQLAFYRGIVQPKESRAGVRVYEFKVVPTQTTGLYRYELVLIQSVRHDRQVKGSVVIEFEGLQAEAAAILPLVDVTLNSAENLVFSFKYFQEFSGEFRLPDGFEPVRVKIVVDPKGRRDPRIEDVYQWNRILGG